MVDMSLLAAFVAAIFVLSITPGPDMMFIVAMGGRGGSGMGVMAAAGVACGMLVHACAAALGLSALFGALPVLYHVLRWLGAAYLLYLAVRAFRDRSVPGDEDGAADADGKRSGPRPRRAFWQGMVTNLLNPKVIMFNIAFLPQFVDPGRGHLPLQLLVLGITGVVVGFCVDGSVGLLSGRLSRALRRSRRLARGLN
ncbi:LysE family translocator, partial [Streptomyces phytophilus]|uniref:LysE family translocator n=1 Tax=Streptomyces phytophilus TaxID=722715 RepID=UPI0015F01887